MAGEPEWQQNPAERSFPVGTLPKLVADEQKQRRRLPLVMLEAVVEQQ